MKWFYKDIGLNRKQAEEKILSLNFKPAKNRGWEIPLKKQFGIGARIHIVPSNDYMDVHQDTIEHKVAKNEKAKYRCYKILEKLNHQTFLEKIKSFFSL